jgi:hypothetical protein
VLFIGVAGDGGSSGRPTTMVFKAIKTHIEGGNGCGIDAGGKGHALLGWSGQGGVVARSGGWLKAAAARGWRRVVAGYKVLRFCG